MKQLAFALLLALPIPAAAQAKLAVFAVNNGQETAVGSTYDFGKVAMGDTRQVVFRIRNTGSVSATITTLSVNGAGFAFVNPLLVPISILPSSFQDVTLAFVAAQTLNYSANFQANSISVLLVGSSAPAATLSSGLGCTGPLPTGGTINFGNVQAGSSSTCTYTLRNTNNQSVVVNTFSVSGTGFSGPQGVRTPLTLLAGELVTFTITFAPASAVNYTGTMVIDSRAFQLAGIGVAPLFPTPVLNTQTAAVHSGQQRTLTVQLPSPAPLAATGNITLTYSPDSPLIQDDPAVMFVPSGSRSIAFSVKQGDTQVLLAGRPSATFQTGASSGKIRFSLSASTQLQGDPTKILIVPPDVVSIDSASALKLAGSLKIQFTGLDNTLSTGSLTFTFYDPSGNALDGGIVHADFTSAFRDYFSKSTVAGMFQAAVNFPVSGDTSQIAFVDVQIANPAGTASTSRLAFP